MRKRVDWSARRYGRWTVVSFGRRCENRRVYWNCVCDCGTKRSISDANLTSGKSASCGCAHKAAIHGHSRRRYESRTYRSWANMIQRCSNQGSYGYKWYGARGIRVCDRWFQFENFFSDMGEAPSGLTIDRKDSNGNYELVNCRWATMAEQSSNKRNSKIIEHNNERLTQAEWARRTGINRHTIGWRLKSGWPIAKALTT